MNWKREKNVIKSLKKKWKIKKKSYQKKDNWWQYRVERIFEWIKNNHKKWKSHTKGEQGEEKKSSKRWVDRQQGVSGILIWCLIPIVCIAT